MWGSLMKLLLLSTASFCEANNSPCKIGTTQRTGSSIPCIKFTVDKDCKSVVDRGYVSKEQLRVCSNHQASSSCPCEHGYDRCIEQAVAHVGSTSVSCTNQLMKSFNAKKSPWMPTLMTTAATTRPTTTTTATTITTKAKPTAARLPKTTLRTAQEHGLTERQIQKKAALQLLVISSCMVCVLFFQLMFIRLLRNAHRQHYEHSVRNYLRELRAKCESSQINLLEKEVKSSASTALSTSSATKPPDVKAQGFFARTKKSMESVANSKEVFKKALTPFGWRAPSKMSDQRSLDLYTSGDKKDQKTSTKSDGFFAIPQEK